MDIWPPEWEARKSPCESANSRGMAPQDLIPMRDDNSIAQFAHERNHVPPPWGYMSNMATVSHGHLGTMVVKREVKPKNSPINGVESHRRTKGDIKGFSKEAATLLRTRIQFSRLRSGGHCLLNATFTLPPPRRVGAGSRTACIEKEDAVRSSTALGRREGESSEARSRERRPAGGDQMGDGGERNEVEASYPPESVRKCWNWWQTTLTRKFPSVGWFWRVELQAVTRRPHWHMVGFCPTDIDREIVTAQLHDLWMKFLDKLEAGRSRAVGADKYADLIKWEGDIYKTSIYLSMHSCKHKARQLGWIGKQWGCINARVLDWSPVAVTEVRQRSIVEAKRWFRRYARSRLWLIRQWRSHGGTPRPYKGIGGAMWSIYDPDRYADYLASLLRGRVPADERTWQMLRGYPRAERHLLAELAWARHPNSGIGSVTDPHLAAILRLSLIHI